ncbi:MAG: prepilin-type N-terminal cleavage/methylation domain-containing protein [Dissulfuribacterales bacterium]
MRNTAKNGFTLVELLVAMAIASIVMAAIVSAYQIQVMGKNTQEIITDMNQTARAALEIMAQEIRMAGCNPKGIDENANGRPRIITASPGELIFSLDIDDNLNTKQPDGDCCDSNEVIRYCLTNDAAGDGINDSIASGVECHLGRETGPGNDPDLACGGVSGLQPLARNVDVLNFVYLDEDGVVIGAPVGVNDLKDIRSIEITLVARAGKESGGFLYSYTNKDTYKNQQGTEILSAQNDRFRRLQLTTTINCRNPGR